MRGADRDDEGDRSTHRGTLSWRERRRQEMVEDGMGTPSLQLHMFWVNEWES